MSQSVTKDNFNVANFDFLSVPQFKALSQHFQSVIESIDDNDNPNWIRIEVEFSRLLNAFHTCFRNCEKKTRKIHELRALNTIEAQKNQSVDSSHDATMQELRNAISNLQRDLDCVNDQKRQLLDDIDYLNACLDTRNMTNQIREESLAEKPFVKDKSQIADGSQYSELENDNNAIQPEPQTCVPLDQICPGTSSKSENNRDVTDIKVLTNNLAILILDLKSTRNTILQLKREIQEKEDLIRDLNEDLRKSEEVLMQVKNELSEIQKSLEMKAHEYKAESDAKRRKIEDISKTLKKAEHQNTKFTKDIIMKDMVIRNLLTNLEDLDVKASSACCKAEEFEKNLAESHTTIESLKEKISALATEVNVLKKNVPAEQDKSIAADPVLNTKGEAGAQQRTIDSLRSRVIARDQKVSRLEEELGVTVKVLQNTRQELNAGQRERAHLREEVSGMKKRLKGKTAEMKQLKKTLDKERQQLHEARKELKNRIKMHQHAANKRDVLHSKCNQMKLVNSQQKKENTLLMKRQEYLVKILKEKDMEIEKTVTWKRYIY